MPDVTIQSTVTGLKWQGAPPGTPTAHADRARRARGDGLGFDQQQTLYFFWSGLALRRILTGGTRW
jgi:hypothetical protein